MILSDNKMTTQEVMTEQLTTEWNNEFLLGCAIPPRLGHQNYDTPGLKDIPLWCTQKSEHPECCL